MGRRHHLNEYRIFNAVDSATSPTSAPTDISTMDKIVYKFTIDPTVNMDVMVNVCNTAVYDASQEYALGLPFPVNMNGSDDTEQMIIIENKGFKWVSLYCQNNGGSGPISGWVSGTSVGA